MRNSQIAVILYSLSAHVQTEKDLRNTLGRLRDIGYENVQVSGIRNPELTPAIIRSACDEAGLGICATHEAAQAILESPEEVVARLKTFGTPYTAYPFPADIDLGNDESIDRWLASLEASFQVLKAGGCHLCYHNHHREFARSRGRPILERIYSETSLQGEPDTYWIQAGGGSVLDWITRLAGQGRLPLLHLKDMAITASGETRYAPVGSGNIQFSPLIEAAEMGGCEYFIVEQDDSYGLDPFEEVAKSYRYLRDNYVDRS